MLGQRPHGEWFPLIYDASLTGGMTRDGGE
jgi:hypothetical protein